MPGLKLNHVSKRGHWKFWNVRVVVMKDVPPKLLLWTQIPRHLERVNNTHFICPIFLKFCTEHGNLTAVLEQNGLKTSKWQTRFCEILVFRKDLYRIPFRNTQISQNLVCHFDVFKPFCLYWQGRVQDLTLGVAQIDYKIWTRQIWGIW